MSKPKTILHTRVIAGSGGGPDKTILRSASKLDKAKYRLAAAYIHPAGDPGIELIRGSADRFGMPLHAIPERGALDIRTVRLMLDICKRQSVDVWHSHDYKTDILGRLICKRHPMKLVSTMHGFTGETWRTRTYARLADRALRGYDRVIAVSPMLIEHAAERGINPNRLIHIPNAINLAEFARSTPRGKAKYDLGLAKDEHAIGVVARFSVEKGVDRAMKLFAQLHRKRPETRLHLIGDGPERANLERLADELGITYAIRWWGWQSDTRPIMQAMDTLLLTSHTEGLPNVVLEAMAVGLPVAATSVGALPDVLDYGTCGVLLNDDESLWPEEVHPLLSQPMVRERMISAASVRLKERYDFTKRMERVEAVYDGLLRMPTANASLTREAA